MAVTLRLDFWSWMAGLQMIKKHAKQYFANLHFMESLDLHKALNSKTLQPNVLVRINKETEIFS